MRHGETELLGGLAQRGLVRSLARIDVATGLHPDAELLVAVSTVPRRPTTIPDAVTWVGPACSSHGALSPSSSDRKRSLARISRGDAGS